MIVLKNVPNYIKNREKRLFPFW